MAYGEFSDLESWLQEHGIPYTRKSDGKYEHDPVVVEFRPDRGLHECTANKGLEPVLSVKPLRKVVRRLQAVMAVPAKKKPKKARKQVKRALELLTRHLPPELPPLPPLEIVADTCEVAGDVHVAPTVSFRQACVNLSCGAVVRPPGPV